MKYDFEFESDIVIVGAGTAGALCAVAAAQSGKSVTVIEQSGCAGGSAVQALVTPMMSNAIEGTPQCSYLGKGINQRLLDMGLSHGRGFSFDPLVMGILYEELLTGAGVRLLYHTTLCAAQKEQGALSAVEVTSIAGRGLIRGKVFADCTGDALLSAMSGAEIMQGDEKTGKNQPVSLRYMVGGVDMARFYTYMGEMEREMAAKHCTKGQMLFQGKYEPGKQLFETAVTNWATQYPLKDLFEQCVRSGELTEEDYIYWQVFDCPGRRDTLCFNNPEFFDVPDVTSPEALTSVQVRGKKAIMRQLAFYKKHFPGFEDAYISAIAPMVGIRESRRAVTEHVLSLAEVSAYTKANDNICSNNYGVDVHGKSAEVESEAGSRAVDSDKWYDIPYRCLVVKGIDNLLVAGRCVGADFRAQSSLRVQIPCRAMGEAAGIAAAMCAEQSIPARQLDGALVREEMIKRGADFPKRTH